MSDLHTRLTEIFHDIFEDDAIVLRDNMTADDVENWDSLSHINLIVAVEKKFHIRFTTAEVATLKNVGELEALVNRKVNTRT